MVTQQHGQSSNPYKGLLPYAAIDAGTFNGRQDLIDAALSKLIINDAQHHPFLMLIGQSATGKSSLIHAGIIPALQTQQPGHLYSATLFPFDLHNDPFKGLVNCLASSGAGALFAGEHLRDIVVLIKKDPEGFFSLLAQKLAQLGDDSRFVLVIQGLEYLFSNPSLNPLQKRYFGELIARLSTQSGVLLIVSLRSDQYHLLSETPALMALKQNSGQLDISLPSLAQIKDIIEAPLQGQQIVFETQQEQSLVDVIASRAYEFPNSLPLLSFLLAKLYELRNSDGQIRFSAYRQLGGLDSVLPSCAEKVYDSLERSVRRHFNRVFTRLAFRSDAGRYEMQWVSLEELARSERAEHFIDTFVQAGLLKIQVNADGVQVVSLAHECLLQHWPRLVQTLDSHQHQLQLKEQLLQQAKQWETATRPSAYLISGKQSLQQAKRLLKHEGKLEPAVKALIQASFSRVKRNQFLMYSGVGVVSVAFMLVLMQSYLVKMDAKQAQLSLDESHKLIEFLIADEHEKLNQIGRLDVMAEGSQKSLEYLSKVTRPDESSASKLSRSNTFHQIGEVYLQTQQFDDAILAFTKALVLNQQLLEIHPNGFVYAMELARAYYWLAKTHRLAGDWTKAEHAYQSYQKVAYDLVKMKPDDGFAKLELSRAYQNMAEMAVLQGQNERAMQNYLESIKFAEKGRMVATDEQLIALVQSYAWLSGQYQKELKLTESVEMAKGQVLASQSLFNQSGLPAHHNMWLLAQWDYTQKLILVGKNKLAVSILQDINQAIEDSPARNTQNEQQTWLQAFTLSRQAQIYLITGKSEKAAELMAQSVAILFVGFNTDSELWRDSMYERQYWMARLALESKDETRFAQISEMLTQASHAESEKWKIRLANLTQQPVELPSLQQQSKTTEPYKLIGFVEYATIHQVVDDLPYLRDLVPQEMWLYPEMETLRDQIRQLL